MLNIIGTRIELTRGDSAYIGIPAADEDRETPFLFEDGDAVRLQVRGAKSHSGTLIFDGVIRIQDGVPIWFISPEQSAVDPGTYYWDIQYVKDENHVMTYNSGTLKITPEVTV